jgi:DNA-binding transcriptional ArsR family regulator
MSTGSGGDEARSNKNVFVEYWEKGLNVVAVRDKTPLHKWEHLINQRQTKEELDSLPIEKANGIAVVLGTKLEEGYLAVIDFDVKNLPSEVVEKGQEILAKLPETLTERTPSGGLHLFYFSKTEPKSISSYHNKCALELLGKGKLCVVSPTPGYEVVKKAEVAIVDDINELFLSAIKNAGIDVEQEEKYWFDAEEYKERKYEGKDPPCIQRIKLGTEEGQRNEYAIRYASYLLNFKKVNPDRAWKTLLKWNNENSPPLDKKELHTIFKSATRGYVYGCSDPILSSLCSPDCPFYKKREKKEEKPEFPPEVEEEIENEVKRIIEAENQIEAIKPHLDNVIAGEEDNKIPIFILLASGKLIDPGRKQIIVIKGTEGTGKSTIATTLTRGYKTKAVARFSAHALDYSDLNNYEVLYLTELGAMDMEKQGVSTLKFLSADDKGYTVEITEKDPETGKMKTTEYRIPAMTVITTTTRVSLEPQFERRVWLFTTDDGEEQTRRVRKFKVNQEIENTKKMIGQIKITSYEFSSEVLRRFVERMELFNVVLPFPESIDREIKTRALRIRSDLSKIYEFIKLYALFNKKRLVKIDENTYAVTPEVAIEAMKLIAKALARMHTQLEERQMRVLNVLRELSGSITVQLPSGDTEMPVDYTKAGKVIDKSLREKIAVRLGKSERYVRRILNSLEEAGYLSSDEKKPKTYILLYDLDEITGDIVRGIMKIGDHSELINSMIEEAKNNFGIEFRPDRVGGLDMIGTSKKPGPDNGSDSLSMLRSRLDIGRQGCENVESDGKMRKPGDDGSNGTEIRFGWTWDNNIVYDSSWLISTGNYSATVRVEGGKPVNFDILQHPPCPIPTIQTEQSESISEANGATAVGPSSPVQSSELFEERNEKLIYCPICLKSGRKIGFTNEEDLRRHIRARHESREPESDPEGVE